MSATEVEIVEAMHPCIRSDEYSCRATYNDGRLDLIVSGAVWTETEDAHGRITRENHGIANVRRKWEIAEGPIVDALQVTFCAAECKISGATYKADDHFVVYFGSRMGLRAALCVRGDIIEVVDPQYNKCR